MLFHGKSDLTIYMYNFMIKEYGNFNFRLFQDSDAWLVKKKLPRLLSNAETAMQARVRSAGIGDRLTVIAAVSGST